MSHTTTIKGVHITNADAIRLAVNDLRARGIDIALKTNATPRMYYREQEREVGKCEFVLSLPKGHYDVGLKWNADTNQYDPVFDEYMGDVSNNIGATCPIPADLGESGNAAIGQFTQLYGRHATRMAAQAQGYMVEQDYIDADGVVQMILTES